MDTDFDLLLGRALIAAAWADGQLDPNEREALEDLLLGLPELAPETWRALHADLDRPVRAEHRQRLIGELESAISDTGRCERARDLIEALAARLEPESEEARILREVSNTLQTPDAHGPAAGGLFARLQSAFASGLPGRSGLVQRQRQSELEWESTLKARLANHWPEGEPWPDDADLHRICTGAAILAHVVRLDGAIDPGETRALGRVLREQWGLSRAAARLAAEVVLDETAGGLDLHLVLREFQRATTEDERQRFLAAVFTVAAGDGRATYDEIEEVRRIGRGLLLSHQHFIAAKLDVPAPQRET